MFCTSQEDTGSITAQCPFGPLPAPGELVLVSTGYEGGEAYNGGWTKTLIL